MVKPFAAGLIAQTPAPRKTAPAPARPAPDSSSFGFAQRLMHAAHLPAQFHQLHAPAHIVRAGVELAAQFGIEFLQSGNALLQAVKRKVLRNSLGGHWLAIKISGD